MLVAKNSISGRVFALLVFLQGALIVTGGAVRVTGSGLGCPTWPECTPGSYTPVPGQAEGAVHAWIEFGNRLLTFVLLITALAAVIFSIKYSKNLINKIRIRTLALLQLLGILGQGVLGGITVLTDLHPLPVGVVKEAAVGLAKPILPLLIWLTLFVLIAGTIVTGSGPHAGDEQAQRFGFDPRVVSWLHADLVIALLVLTSMLFLITRQIGQTIINKRVGLFLLICLAQGLVGYVQYFTGLPVVLVAIHLLGATLVWVSGWSLVKVADSGFKLKGFHL